MFENVRRLFGQKAPFVEAVGTASSPSLEAQRGRKAWVVMEDGRVGYIDHYKADGKFGVRPVDYHTGLHFPNPSQHWTNEQRLKVPEELALSFGQMREATEAEVPMMYRRTKKD